MKTCDEVTSAREIRVRETLSGIIDPEIGLNIVDIGLVYGIEADSRNIRVRMTMTSPACPMGEMLLDEVHAGLRHAYPDIEPDIELVWEPQWTPDMMSPEAKALLGWEHA
ncbi:MAG TPA: metal-sulfur cluster assembly factor [Methylophilaceae bacterium]|nr:metal-sulfur cluster assembly factor [Methylophilaceae bacterium]